MCPYWGPQLVQLRPKVGRLAQVWIVSTPLAKRLSRMMRRLPVLLLAGISVAFLSVPVASQAPARPPAAETQPPETVRLRDHSTATRVPYKPGDICLACNNPVHEHDPVYLVNGQRIPIHQQEVSDDLPAQLQALLGLIQPRGAFIGAQQAQRALSSAWFWSGLYILIGLVFGAICAHRALQTGYGALRWFLAGLAFNLVAFAVLRMKPGREVLAPAGIPPGLGKIAATYSPESCVKCGTLNHPSASACSGCGAKLEPKLSSEVARVGLD